MTLFRRATRLLSLATLVLIAGGCAAYAWQKPGGTEEAAVQDRHECSLRANRTASDFDWRTLNAAGWPGDAWHYPVTHIRNAYIWGPDPPRLYAEIERDAFSRCMEVKGYQFVEEPRS